MAEFGLDIALTTDIYDRVSNAKGVANYIRFLSSKLASVATEHTFATAHFEASDAEPYQQGFADLVIEPYPIPDGGFQRLVTNRFRGRRELASLDVVHLMAPRLYYFPLLPGGDYKTVMTVHAMDLHIPPGMDARLTSEPHAWLQQRLLGAYFELVRDDLDAIITVSEFLKNELIDHKGISAEKIHPVHHAPAEHFQPIDAEADRAFILSDTPEPELIEMFRRLKEVGFDQELVVFSMRGYGYEQARRKVDEYGLGNEVEFLGYVPDETLVELYNTAQVYVRFAGYEGFGLPPLEAMACGCPVVTTNVGSLPEVVSDAGELLEPNDVEGFVDGVARLLSNPEYREAMIDAGLERASLFSWERTARETVDVYESITGYSES